MKRLAAENLSEIEVHNYCRYHFRGFQIGLHIIDTKNFEIGSVVAKLQQLTVCSQPCTKIKPNVTNPEKIGLFSIAESDFPRPTIFLHFFRPKFFEIVNQISP